MEQVTQDIQNKLKEDIEKLKSREGYINAGYPNYNTLFGRDSLIAAWQLLEYDPSIAKSTLSILAEYQAKEYNNKKESEPGKILHEYRLSNEARKKLPGWGWPYYGTVDATSLFLIVLAEYVKETQDLEFLEKIWINVVKALEWHFNNAKQNTYGFITYNPRNPHGLVHQGWKDSIHDHLKISPPVAIVEEQGYAYKAYRAFIELSGMLGERNPKLSKKAAEYAEKLKYNFDKKFWIEEEEYFAIGLNGENKQRKSVASNMGHLLFCDDFVDEDKATVIKNRLFKHDMLTIGGVRTLSEKDPDFDAYSYHLGSIWPHDNWFFFIGLLARGYDKEARRIKLSILQARKVLGNIPELFAVDPRDNKIYNISKTVKLKDSDSKTGEAARGFNANPLQAWASGALLDILTTEV